MNPAMTEQQISIHIATTIAHFLRYSELMKVVKVQQNTPGLWAETETELERWLQQELKRLHELIDSKEELSLW